MVMLTIEHQLFCNCTFAYYITNGNYYGRCVNFCSHYRRDVLYPVIYNRAEFGDGIILVCITNATNGSELINTTIVRWRPFDRIYSDPIFVVYRSPMRYAIYFI